MESYETTDAEKKSREERIREAKSAFAGGRTLPAVDEHSQDDMTQGISRHPFRLLRVVTAVMLFFLLVIALYFDFSYHGFNREFIEHCLQDDTLWQKLTSKAAECIAVFQR